MSLDALSSSSMASMDRSALDSLADFLDVGHHVSLLNMVSSFHAEYFLIVVCSFANFFMPCKLQIMVCYYCIPVQWKSRGPRLLKSELKKWPKKLSLPKVLSSFLIIVL